MRWRSTRRLTEYGVLASTEPQRDAGTGRRLDKKEYADLGLDFSEAGYHSPYAQRGTVCRSRREIRHTRIVLTPTESGCVDYGKEAMNQGPDCARCVSLSILFIARCGRAIRYG